MRLPDRLVAGVMAVGAGVLVSSVAYELVGEAAQSTTLPQMAAGMALGSVSFFVGDLLVSRRGAARRKMSVLSAATTGSESGSGAGAGAAAGSALAVGALLDGVPESAAIGVTLLHGGAPSAAFVVAVALSNLPEGLSSSMAMRRHGHGVRFVLTVWTAITVASGAAAAAGYAALGGASDGSIALVMSFAAGAVLTMLASTMFPEAAREGGPITGLLTTAGFVAAVLLDRL